MNSANITEGIRESVWNAVDIAIDNNEVEILKEFVSFFRDVLLDSVKYDHIEYFQQYIMFPSHIYDRYISNNRRSIGNDVVLKDYMKKLALHLREVIAHDIRGEIKEEEHRDAFNLIAFTSFNNYFYRLCKSSDWDFLNTALDYYKGLAFLIDTKSINYQKYYRRPLRALKYWLYFLYSNKLLEVEKLLKLVDAINKSIHSNIPDEIEDLLYFRTGDSFEYMSWNNWDHENHRGEGVYYPPQTFKWVTLGFVVDRIRMNNSYFSLQDLSDFKNSVVFLRTSIKEEEKNILASFEGWKHVFNVSDVEFKKRIQNLLSSISLLEKEILLSRVNDIAIAPLSLAKIDEFQKITSANWKNESGIVTAFKYFGNIHNIDEKQRNVEEISQYVFLQKAKVMFIEGDHSLPISGIGRITNELNHRIDNFFIKKIINISEGILRGVKFVDVFEKVYSRFDKVDSTYIFFVDLSLFYGDLSVIQSKRYSSTNEVTRSLKESNVNVLGLFDDIPIVGLSADRLKGKVVLCNFSTAFQMRIVSNENLYDNLLNIEVNDILEKYIDDILKRNPNDWLNENGITLTIEEAKNLIKTSVYVKASLFMDFSITNEAKVAVGAVLY